MDNGCLCTLFTETTELIGILKKSLTVKLAIFQPFYFIGKSVIFGNAKMKKELRIFNLQNLN